MTPVYGKNVHCRVFVVEKLDELQIGFQNNLLETRKLAGAYYELARDLADFCECRTKCPLMGQVLHEDDPHKIEEFLTKEGIGYCKDEEKSGQIKVDLEEPAGTRMSRRSSGPNEDLSANKINNSSLTTSLGKHRDGRHPRHDAPAPNLQVKALAESVPALEDDARRALQSSVRKARIAVVVPTGQFARKPGMSYTTAGNNAVAHRATRASVEDSLGSANPPNEDRDVGLQGEYATYRILKIALEERFSPANWTSELQQFAGPHFSAWKSSPGEDDASDFTYFDKDKRLLSWLLSKDVAIAEIWQKEPLTFHIEVKSTTKSYDEVFHLSRLQKMKAERLTAPSDGSTPKGIFLIFRLYDLSTDRDREPGVQIYVDPFKLFEEGVLECEAEGWLVGVA